MKKEVVLQTPIAVQVENMIAALNGIKKDAASFDKGKNAPGTRVRQAMQRIKDAAQTIRVDVVRVRNAR